MDSNKLNSDSRWTKLRRITVTSYKQFLFRYEYIYVLLFHLSWVTMVLSCGFAIFFACAKQDAFILMLCIVAMLSFVCLFIVSMINFPVMRYHHHRKEDRKWLIQATKRGILFIVKNVPLTPEERDLLFLGKFPAKHEIYYQNKEF